MHHSHIGPIKAVNTLPWSKIYARTMQAKVSTGQHCELNPILHRQTIIKTNILAVIYEEYH